MALGKTTGVSGCSHEAKRSNPINAIIVCNLNLITALFG
jgi:hypothetical protein